MTRSDEASIILKVCREPSAVIDEPPKRSAVEHGIATRDDLPNRNVRIKHATRDENPEPQRGREWFGERGEVSINLQRSPLKLRVGCSTALTSLLTEGALYSAGTPRHPATQARGVGLVVGA